MKGMPHLYYATGAARPTRWVGDTLVVAADAEEMLRRAQDEDTRPWFETSWRLPRPRALRLSRSAK